VWVIKRITGNDSSFVTQYYTGNDDWTYSIDKAEIIDDQDLATTMVRGINSDIEPASHVRRHYHGKDGRPFPDVGKSVKDNIYE
tara:strand:+ start:315 stop:566 length:252 start_codon:yes stop_codon:yes gene_type:complete